MCKKEVVGALEIELGYKASTTKRIIYIKYRNVEK
jgi:hypothetical protein